MNNNKPKHDQTDKMEDELKKCKEYERKISFVADVAIASNVIMGICAVIAYVFESRFMMWMVLGVLVADCIFEELYLRFAK